MQIARDRFDRVAALMFATTVSRHGDTTPPCERAANDWDPPPRPASAAGRPSPRSSLRVAA